jgi:hypothetical protein
VIYTMRAGRIARFKMQPDLPSALASADMTEQDEAADN